MRPVLDIFARPVSHPLCAVLIALASVELTMILRTLDSIPASWKDRKPLGCDVCMAAWPTLLLALGAWFLSGGTYPTPLELGGACGAAYTILRHLPPPPRPLP